MVTRLASRAVEAGTEAEYLEKHLYVTPGGR